MRVLERLLKIGLIQISRDLLSISIFEDIFQPAISGIFMSIIEYSQRGWAKISQLLFEFILI